MTEIGAEDIQYHRNTTMVHLTKKQVIELVAAIDENMKIAKGMLFKGVELMTILEPAGPKIRVGLWREEEAESSE